MQRENSLDLAFQFKRANRLFFYAWKKAHRPGVKLARMQQLHKVLVVQEQVKMWINY